MSPLAKWIPLLEWGRHYRRSDLASDGLAAVIVTIMLIPQSLAYALLAGLPAEMGLYASILPLLAYGLFGTSRTLSVGPVAVVSLMTASALGEIAATGSVSYLQGAMLLALMSGGMLLTMGLLRLGVVANFLSHSVIAGFITASGLIIAASQLRHLLGVSASGDNLLQLLAALFHQLGSSNWPTMAIGVGTLVFLYWVRSGLKPLLMQLGMTEFAAGLLARAGPVLAVLATSVIAYSFGLDEFGVALVGRVPTGLPVLGWPSMVDAPWAELASAALFISLIGFVESVSVGRTLAAKRRQRIVPNQELVGLGAANIAAGVSGGFPVTGGFARSVVNFDAGAATPAAGMLTAVGIALTALFFTPYLAYLPVATLAATIIVAVSSLIDFSILKRTWQCDKTDFSAVAITVLVTLAAGVEMGVACGVLASIGLHLYKTSQPHMAVVGEVPGTEHYRNVDRHQVITHQAILSLRVDESLYFANASVVEERIFELTAASPAIRHVVLLCSAINKIDFSALEVLEAANLRLREQGVCLHLSEVKGPVMDYLQGSGFLHHLSGQVYLSHHDAVQKIIATEREKSAANVPDWQI